MGTAITAILDRVRGMVPRDIQRFVGWDPGWPQYAAAFESIIAKGEKAIFVADMTTLHYHFQRLAWVTSYDVEPLESIETKRYWQQWAVEHEALILFQHDTQVVAGKLHPDPKG